MFQKKSQHLKKKLKIFITIVKANANKAQREKREITESIRK